jgi:2-methylcitrate dehydratase PrpD
METKPLITIQPSLAVELAEALELMRTKAQTEKAFQAATRCVLDYFASVLAGLSEPVSGEIMNGAETLGGNQMATAFCGGEQTSVPMAALVNGTLAHAQDFDDTLWSYIGHCSAVIFSAALATAEWLDKSGAQLLTSFALGVEAAHRIGSVVVSHLTHRGWHPTPAVGVFGSAVATTAMMASGPNLMADALTTATNLASGLRQNFGSKAKPLAAGWSAFSGVMASILAHQGISGSADALEGRQGYFYTFAGRIPQKFAIDDNKELVLVSPGPGFKLYPCCTGAHPAIDAILMIKRKKVFAPEEVAAVRIEVTPEVLDELIYPVPLNERQAKFSLPYCAAVALVYGAVKVGHFSEQSLKNPLVTDLLHRIDVYPDEDLKSIGAKPCPSARVTITTQDGQKIGKTVKIARGNPGNPLSLEDMKTKFHQCAMIAGLNAEKAEQFFQQLSQIRDIPSINRWMHAYVAPLFQQLKKG